MNVSEELPNTTQNNSSSSNQGMGGFPRYYEEPMGLTVAKLTIQVAIALVGVVGSLLVCIVITKRANLKTTMNLYLRNLAIADLGVLLVNFPISVISEHVKTGYPFGRFVCLYIAPATEIFYGASIWSITIIAIERYKNIISRRAFGKRVEPFKRVTLKILLIWLTSFLVVAVPMYPIMFYDGHYCFPNWPTDHKGMSVMLITYIVGLTIFWYLLPLGIITYTYLRISRRLVQSNEFHKGMHGKDDFSKSQLIRQEEKQRLKQNKKAQRILTPLVIVFATSMLPLTIFRLTFAFYPAFRIYEYYLILLSVCALFVVVNSAADPIVYYISSKEFRKVVEAWLCKRRNSDESSTLGKPQRFSLNTQNTCTVVQTNF